MGQGYRLWGRGAVERGMPVCCQPLSALCCMMSAAGNLVAAHKAARTGRRRNSTNTATAGCSTRHTSHPLHRTAPTAASSVLSTASAALLPVSTVWGTG